MLLSFVKKCLMFACFFARRAGSLRACLPPIFFYKNCFQFLLGITFVPRESENNVCVKFCGVNKLYHGQCERAGECFLTCVFVTYFFRCVLHGVVWQTTFICILFCSCSIRLWPKGLIRGVRKCNIHTPAQTAAQTAQYTGTCNLSLFCQLSTPDVSIFLLMRLQ